MENSVAVHIFNVEDKGEDVKRKVNHHIADNWDNFYQNKITLPHKVTVGVVEHATEVDPTLGPFVDPS